MIYFLIIPDVVLWILLLLGYGMLEYASHPSFEQKILVYLLVAYTIGCILPIIFFLKSETQSSIKAVIFLHYMICTLGTVMEACILMDNQSDITVLAKRCIIISTYGIYLNIVKLPIRQTIEKNMQILYFFLLLFFKFQDNNE